MDERKWKDIWSAEEVRNLDTAPGPARTVMKWIDSYITRSHPSLGRAGVVCPFVPPALAVKSLWLAIVRDSRPSKDEMCGALKEYMTKYEHLEPRTGETKSLKVLVLIFPGVPRESAIELIGGVHAIMKPLVVEAGLMLGEFFEGNDSPGLYNRDFHPLCSPVPLFVYRQMVADDLVFLTKKSDSPASRIRFISSYLKNLGANLSSTRLSEAKVALAAARHELDPIPTICK